MIIDLCCGIGRFETPDEEVVSIDIDPKTKPTICADINHLPLKPNMRIRYVHASPTCTYFSKARRWGTGWNPKGAAESLRLVAACYAAFAYLGAQNCSLENPAGIEDILGHKVKFKYDKYDIKNATTNIYLNKKAQKRAVIPQDIRQEMLFLTNSENRQ